MRNSEPTRDFGAEAHRAAVAHLADCFAVMHLHEEFDGSEDELAESPASATFDGCDDCQVRETLYAAWPILREAALTEQDGPRGHLSKAVTSVRALIATVSRSTRRR